jgi:hypothetical protein
MKYSFKKVDAMFDAEIFFLKTSERSRFSTAFALPRSRD